MLRAKYEEEMRELDIEYIKDVMLRSMDSKQIEEHLIMLIYRLSVRGYEFIEIEKMMNGALR